MHWKFGIYAYDKVRSANIPTYL